jgi:hypothetical protein
MENDKLRAQRESLIFHLSFSICHLMDLPLHTTNRQLLAFLARIFKYGGAP